MRLTDNNAPDNGASFSPDGSRIAFSRNNGLLTMAADGSDQRLVGGPAASGFTPRWSPDGSTLAFTYYSDAYRPWVALGVDYGPRPLVIAAVVDVATGQVTRLPKIGMASDSNTPQWVDNGHLLMLRVPVRG